MSSRKFEESIRLFERAVRRLGYVKREIELQSDLMDEESLQVFSDSVEGLQQCVQDFNTIAANVRESR